MVLFKWGALQTFSSMLFPSDYKILLAKDSKGQIRSIASYMNKKVSLYVSEILSAPENVRWPRSFNPTKPLRGGGVLLLDALFKIAIKEDMIQMYLTPSETSSGFYEKIGMIKLNGGFQLCTAIPEHQARITAAMQRTFGPDFHYSLLLEESKKT